MRSRVLPSTSRAAGPSWFSTARLSLLASLGLCWANYALTSRWADVPGALHGPKEYWFVAVLGATTALALTAPVGRVPSVARSGRLVALGAFGLLTVMLLIWFPPETWRQIPFQDNWPARYQSTLDQIALFRRGAVVGWQWNFLGGYHLSSDLTVSLAILAWLPVAIFGPAFGFHLLHAILFAAIPILIWLDLRHEPNANLKWCASAIAALLACSYSYRLLGSGDTNSLAGVVTTLAALVAAHEMRWRRWGGPALVLALTLVMYSHAGFFLFAASYLAVDAALSRDRQRALSIGTALLAAFIAGLPLTFESWVHPAYFTPNNALLEPPPLDWEAFARKAYYNLELLVLPGRWLNDYTGVAAVFLPLYVFAAVKASGRARFHACAALVTILITRLYDPQHLGWGLIRAAHMHVAFAAPVLGWFIVSCSGNRALAGGMLATIALYVQISFESVPHVNSVADWERSLIQRIASQEPSLILLENSYHPEMDGDPSVEMEPTPFEAHFEALLPGATGHRFYAGVWDGWQWAPARRNLLANGAMNGRRIDRVSDAELLAELHQWGIRELLVWSQSAVNRLSQSPAFTRAWRSGRWHHFSLINADIRTVVTASGSGELSGLNPLGATVWLKSVSKGERVVIRTNYYPAWQLFHQDEPLAAEAHHGQLAFHAPASGDYNVELRYPKRRWLVVIAFLGLISGSGLLFGARTEEENATPGHPPW